MVLTGGLSTKMFDYLAMGLPILAPSDGEIPTILKHEENCLLYRTDDVEDFCVRVNDLLSSKSVCTRVANNAYKEFLDRYSWRARMYELIKNLENESII